jgi:DNA-binding response OmpR family regulator
MGPGERASRRTHGQAFATREREVDMARIIIADDDEIVGEIARDALLAGGHGVGLLTNGRDALSVIKARRPDLVILDCNMPDLSGLLVLREMRNSVELCEIPVLMLTGRQSERDVELAMYEGAGDYVKKPFDPEELLFRVDELLAKRHKGGASKPR